jgi:hypothetical protein
VIYSEAYKDTKPQSVAGIAENQNKQTRSRAIQGLLFGSSSSAMFRLVGHGIVSEKSIAAIGHGIVSERNISAAGSHRRHPISSAK